MVIIGITGTLGAGKGTVVEYLEKERGFDHYSVRSYLLEEIRLRGMAENRDSMFNLANELRTLHGPSYVTDQLYLRAALSQRNCIIESIRTPGEIVSLRKKGNFFLFAVDANPELRYRRILERQSETDRISFDTFIENEKREMMTNDPNKQNLQACIREADFLFNNDSTKEELFSGVALVLQKILSPRQ